VPPRLLISSRRAWAPGKPDMDGWLFPEHCRAEPLCGGMPVVVMSAYLGSPVATALNVQAVIAKPFDMYVLADTVEGSLAADWGG
jgi:CheY-like chemotaxis protein